MSKYKRCFACGGVGQVMGVGLMQCDCMTCHTTGYVENEDYYDEDEEANEETRREENTRDYAEQDIFENSENKEAEITLDQSARDSSRGDRQNQRESTLGSGESHLSGAAEGQQDSEEKRRKKGKSKQSSTEV